MKVLVTGGGGFLGRYTCTALQHRGHEVLIYDRHKAPSDWPIMLGDIRDATAVTESVAHAEGVIHLAGVLGTQETITNPRPAAETNILGGLNIFEACAQYRVPLVNIAVGNWFEYSTYSITKHTMERFAEMFSRYRELPVASVRALNAYGPHQSVAAPYGSSKVRKVMPSFISRALHGEPIEVYGDGKQVMDFIWAGDVAHVLVSALEMVARSNQSIGQRLYEAGSGRRTTVLEVAELVRAEVHRQGGSWQPITHLPMRPGETPGVEVMGDPSTLKPLGISPDGFVPLDEGIRRTVSFYRAMYGK